MDVYLVPVAAGRYEPYCESSEDEARVEVQPADSWWRKQLAKFRASVAEAEAELRRRHRGEPTERRGITAWTMGRIAETVVEQRLLWRLRTETTAALMHPDDIQGLEAHALMRSSLESDYRKHRNWCGVDALLAAILGPGLFFIPGPNVVGWYFFFRAIAHFLSLKGARQGLDRVTWDARPSPPLTVIRGIITANDPDCLKQLDDIGRGLGLEHLGPFVKRVAGGRR